MASTASRPCVTWPKIVWRPLSHGVSATVTKNWLPFVFGPAFAIASRPLWLNVGPLAGTSSSNW